MRCNNSCPPDDGLFSPQGIGNELIRDGMMTVGAARALTLPTCSQRAELPDDRRGGYRMGMPETIHTWTREEVLALPEDGNRYELIDGELLVSPSPRGVHQWAVMALYDRLKPYVRQHRIGAIMLAPADLDLRSGQLVQPDLYVVPHRPDGRRPLEWPEFGMPLLIAEVTSPSTARHDRIKKRIRFQRSGVAQYWIVDPDARTVETWRPDDSRPEVLHELVRWHPRSNVAPLVVDLPHYFREVWGEE
jgi:Uma2 family endonuclease